MKILLLSKKFPYPLREGEPIAISYLSRSLRQLGCQIDLLVLNTSKHFFDPQKLPTEFNFFDSIFTVEVNNDITAAGALKSLLRNEPYILSRFFSAPFESKLKAILTQKKYDIVQLETVYMAHYVPVIRKYSTAALVMRAHNVEHEIWQRVADTTSNPFKKWYLRLQNRPLRQFEMASLQTYDLLLAITGRDLQVFRDLGYRNEAVIAPVGIDLKEYGPDYQCFESFPSLAFIGALDWMPNQAGVLWFLENVWPAISAKYPGLTFHVAGKNTPEWIFRKATDRVFVHGEVPDAKKFMNGHSILVAPLFSGSGIKIKVLEGMALGRAVVTTPVGAEGIPAKDGEEFFLAGTPESFIRQLDFCLANPMLLRETGARARAFIRREFDNLEIAARVMDAFEKLRGKP